MVRICEGIGFEQAGALGPRSVFSRGAVMMNVMRAKGGLARRSARPTPIMPKIIACILFLENKAPK